MYGDHPCVRGEKPPWVMAVVYGPGSPPRVRGKVVEIGLRISGGRITPACAGKSEPSCPRKRRAEDHPRMRGEKPLSIVSADSRQGSPPHARGKGYNPQTAKNKGGITPACAGKSSTDMINNRLD